MNYQDYYLSLEKPFFAPPTWLFGVVWTPLYIIIAFTFGWLIFSYFQRKGKIFKKGIPFLVVLPFLLNLFFNLIFTTIQFDLRDNFLAMIDILLTVGTLIWAMIAVYPYNKVIALANIPYLLWGSFATVLQICIWWLNRS